MQTDAAPGTELPRPDTLRTRAIAFISLVIGLFVFYTSFFGAFETLNPQNRPNP